MKGKAVLALLVLCLFLFSCLLIACTKKPEDKPFKPTDTTKATTPTKPQPTPEEKFQQAIKPFVQLLEAAQVLEEGGKPDDPRYSNPLYGNMVSIKQKLASGTTLDQLKTEKPFGVVIEGPFPSVKPTDIHPNLVTLLADLEPGKTTKILWAEGQGYGMVFLKAKDAATGNVEVAVILLPQPAVTTTEKPAEPGATKTEATPKAPPGKGK